MPYWKRMLLAAGAGLMTAIVSIAAPVVAIGIAISSMGFMSSSNLSFAQWLILLSLPILLVVVGALPLRVLCDKWSRAILLSVVAQAIVLFVFISSTVAIASSFSPRVYFAGAGLAFLLGVLVATYMALYTSRQNANGVMVAAFVMFVAVIVSAGIGDIGVALFVGGASWVVLPAVASLARR